MSIYSMTAFAHARMEHEHTLVQLEIRSVNHRYLDLHLRLPDELRFFEPRLREIVAQKIGRGKLDIRLQLQRQAGDETQGVPTELLTHIASQLQQIRTVLPDTAGPDYQELFQLAARHKQTDTERWQELLEQLLEQALADLLANKAREGERLAQAMRGYAQQMLAQINKVQSLLPEVQAEYQRKVAERLREALAQASPEGLQYISAEELSARIAQEASLFSLRIDVSEEMTRLEAHVQELNYLLEPDAGQRQKRRGSLGKRLDFLFQEMNREANTLGSKAANIELTQVAIELKILVDQLREQIQNIE